MVQQTLLIPMTATQLETLIIESVKAVLDYREIPTKEQAKQDDLLTVDETATFLHLAKQTIYERTAAGTIPHMKQGKRLYFSKKELTDYIAKGKRLTTSEAARQANNYLSNQ